MIATTLARTAKLLRTALRESFPDTKFRVRCGRYPVDSIRVDYTDGPDTASLDTTIQSLGAGAYEGVEHVYVEHQYEGGSESRFWRSEPRSPGPWWEA